MKVTAAVVREKSKPFTIEELDLDEPREDEVLVRVLATGICHTDIIVPEVGGAFGCKIDIYPEEMIASFASMKLGRSVKWSEDRSENLAVTVHGRDQTDYVEAAATKEGKITGLKIHGISDLGGLLPALYRCDHDWLWLPSLLWSLRHSGSSPQRRYCLYEQGSNRRLSRRRSPRSNLYNGARY